MSRLLFSECFFAGFGSGSMLIKISVVITLFPAKNHQGVADDLL
jgi:hypothetical protein